jgi:hypothetical protein
MYFDRFSVQITNATEIADGYVEIVHNTRYAIKMQNDRDVDCAAEVTIDGQHVGTWIVPHHHNITIERPVHTAKLFTFYQLGSSEAIQAQLQDNSNLGLISVFFKPEKPKVRRDSDLPNFLLARAANHISGGTGLSGDSAQQFIPARDLDYDLENACTIHLRLVAPAPSDIQALTPRSTTIPPRLEIKSTWKAMTWCVLNIAIIDGKTYALFGADSLTNAYTGDTDTNAILPLLCIKKTDLPRPLGLPNPQHTPGGALRGSWSGGKVIALPNVQGTTLTSQSIADEKCRRQGLQVLGEDGFRMAEFHDGDKNSGRAGWDFWADASAMEMLKISDLRYWVRIDDQQANPWR